MLKNFKFIILLLNFIGIGVTIYYKIFILTILLILLFAYFIYIFMTGNARNTKNDFNKRALISYNIILLCFILIFFRLIQVQIFDKDFYLDKIRKQTITSNKNYWE